MPRIKLTQQQEELIAVFPLAITKSDTFKRLSNAQKLVLAQIDLQDGTDFSEENGYTFASNEAMMENTGIRSKNTIISAVKTLVNEGLIVTQRGRRDKSGSMASEYVLTDKYYGLCDRENPHKKLLNPMGCNKGCNKNEQGCNNYQNQGCNNNTAINPTVEAMQQEISELKKIINELQNQLQKSYCTPDTDIDTDIDTCISENVNKKKMYNRDCNNYTVPVDNTVNDDIFYKKKKINKKEKGNTDSDGTVGDENNFSNFTDMEENTIQRQGEQASNSKSYDDVINAVVNRINKGQSFSEKRLRDYVFEQFISKGTATSEQWDSDFIVLQRLKDLHGDVTEHTVTPTEKTDNVTEDTVTPSSRNTEKNFGLHTLQELMELDNATEDTPTPSSKDAEEDNELNNFNDMKESRTLGDDSHPSSWQGDSPNPNLSAASLPHNDKGSLSEDDSPDEELSIKEEKCAQDAPECEIEPTCDGRSITRNTINGIIKSLGEYFSEGATVTEHEPHKYTINLEYPMSWCDMVNSACGYLESRRLNSRDLCVIAVDDDPRYCNTFQIYEA